jgi:hypothetical protein
MAETRQPPTFEPFEIDEQTTWPIYDENLARIVAVFYDRREAQDYLAWRNAAQAEAKANAQGRR